jgi:hypothetical protein
VVKGIFLTIIEEVTGTIEAMEKVRQTSFFKFISYLEEKKSEERVFSRLRKEFPEILNSLESLEYLITHEILWIEVDGSVRPGKLADNLYSVVLKTSQWAKKE